ncbi:unnamed protein product [Urochloa decumbens]|uniref:Uncharacterized protein n=1 Tax=Urochloa decumbens TaxID=240449 RepID=A0ABC9BUR6_9POAL
MTCDAPIPGQQPQGATTVPVLTEFGGRILHGVLTCILSVHRAGLAFRGACGMDNLRVHVYKGATDQYPLVVSRVYVHDDGGTSSSLVPLDGESQKADYRALVQVIEVLFQDDNSKKALHVGSIYKLLNDLAADNNKDEDDTAGSVITKGLLVDQPVKRTYLLQAYAEMISSPVAVATMCFNLKRFYDQLDGDHKPIFTDALRDAQQSTRLLCDEVDKQPLFIKVYYENNNNSSSRKKKKRSVDRSVPDNPYEGGRTGTGLLTFARNWFTHVPEERLEWRNRKFRRTATTGLHFYVPLP